MQLSGYIEYEKYEDPQNGDNLQLQSQKIIPLNKSCPYL